MTSSPSSNGTKQVAVDLDGTKRSPLAGAAALMSRVEREIDDLWRSSIAVDDPEVSTRLAELSHAVHRASRSLDRRDHEIG